MKQIIKTFILSIAMIAILPNLQAQQLAAEKSELITASQENSSKENNSFDFTEKQSFANVDTTVTIPTVQPFPYKEGIPAMINWFLTDWARLIALLTILATVLESIFSVIPTSRNISIFQNIREFLDKLLLFRNNTAGGGRFLARSEKEQV